MHVAFKPPQPLHLQNPAVWFLILEQQFELAKITQESTKFSHAVSGLDARLHNTFADLIIRDKGATPYTTFKQEVTKYLGESEKSKLHNLLHGLTLGDQKPSQLLSKIQANAGDKFSAEPLRQLWMSRLLPQVQIILTPFENDVTLSVLAQRADDVMEIMSQVNANSVGHIAASSSYNQFTLASDTVENNLNAKFTSIKSEILTEISALLNKNAYSHQRDSSRGRSSSRNRSPSNNRNSSPEICYYHKRFNDKAQKCVSSCKHHKEFLAKQGASKND